jgi:hypothetical protein
MTIDKDDRPHPKEGQRDAYPCFRCGRDLGPHLEWKKMETEAGSICYVCYNEVRKIS